MDEVLGAGVGTLLDVLDPSGQASWRNARLGPVVALELGTNLSSAAKEIRQEGRHQDPETQLAMIGCFLALHAYELREKISLPGDKPWLAEAALQALWLTTGWDFAERPYQVDVADRIAAELTSDQTLVMLEPNLRREVLVVSLGELGHDLTPLQDAQRLGLEREVVAACSDRHIANLIRGIASALDLARVRRLAQAQRAAFKAKRAAVFEQHKAAEEALFAAAARRLENMELPQLAGPEVFFVDIVQEGRRSLMKLGDHVLRRDAALPNPDAGKAAYRVPRAWLGDMDGSGTTKHFMTLLLSQEDGKAPWFDEGRPASQSEVRAVVRCCTGGKVLVQGRPSSKTARLVSHGGVLRLTERAREFALHLDRLCFPPRR